MQVYLKHIYVREDNPPLVCVLFSARDVIVRPLEERVLLFLQRQMAGSKEE